MPENQTAWNSNNQGIKETVNQTNQTSKTGRWREPEVRWQTLWAGLAEQETDSELTVDYGGGLPWWEKLPVSQEGLLESGASAQQVSCFVPSLAPPPQAALQGSKEGCPALMNT